MNSPRYKHAQFASNIHHKLLCRHSEHRRSYQKDVRVLVFTFWACDVKIRHIRWPNTASHPEFIAYIALRCYSNVDAKTGGQYSKALRIPINGAFNAFKCSRYCFLLAPILIGPCSILGYFSRLGASTCLGPGTSCPPLPPPPLSTALYIICQPEIWKQSKVFS